MWSTSTIASLPAESFGDVRALLVDGTKTREWDALLNLEPDKLIVRNRDDGACLAELRSLPPQAIPAVLTNAPRHALARFAIHAGGRGAYSRLVRSAGRPLDERLAAAAGTSADSLLSSWRASVVAARPRNVTLTPASAWTGLLWATAFALIGLRSSRWR